MQSLNPTRSPRVFTLLLPPGDAIVNCCGPTLNSRSVFLSLSMPETKYSMEHVKLIIQQSPVDLKMRSDFMPGLYELSGQYKVAAHFVDRHLLEGRCEKIPSISLID